MSCRAFVATAVVALASASAGAAPDVQELTPSDVVAGDSIGAALDADGWTVVAGAPNHDQDASDAGTAYAFTRCGGFFLLQAELRPLDPQASAHFGHAVAVDGDTIAVGAPDAGGAGTVYVFTRTRAAWSQTAKLTPSNAAPGDRFGAAVDASGGRIVVGAPGRDFGTGSVFVFEESGGAWIQAAALRPSRAVPGGLAEGFGDSVAADGSRIAATSRGLGITSLWREEGGGWTNDAEVAPAVQGPFDFTWSLSLDGGSLAVGAPGDDAFALDCGSVSVFAPVDGSWLLQARISAFLTPPISTSARFGASVALHGGVLASGAPGEGNGRVLVHRFGSAGWTLDRRVAAPRPANDDVGARVALAGASLVTGAPSGKESVFVSAALPEATVSAEDGITNAGLGTSVAVSGDTALVGAPLDRESATGSGAAYVFVREGAAWTQQAKLRIDGPDQFGRAVALDGDTALVGTAGEAAFVYVRTATAWSFQARIDAQDVQFGDDFGRSVALSGGTALVGAPGDDEAGADAGAAYAFLRSGNSWTQQAKLRAADGAPGDMLGVSVGLAGDTALAGATGDDDRGTDAGSAYVFVRSGAVWTQQAKLLATDGAATDELGTSVALSGNTALVGAPFRDGGAVPDVGAAYAFVRTGTTWSQESRIDASDATAADLFGTAVALDADVAVVGAPGDGEFVTEGGAAYFFVRGDRTWSQRRKLARTGAAAGDKLGSAVAVSDGVAVAGVPGATGRVLRSGVASAFEVDVPSWTEVPRLRAPSGSQFVNSLAIDEDALVFGAEGDGEAAVGAGALHVFVRSGDRFVPQAKLFAADASIKTSVGHAVAVDGDTAVATALRIDFDDGPDSGSAYVFTRTGGTWSQQAKLRASDTFDGDLFGHSVALSGDTLLVGAAGSDSAYVFVRSGTAWTQQAKLTGSTGAFGESVALDGDTAVVGTPGADQRVGYSGAVHVFTRSGSTWTPQAKLVPDVQNVFEFGANVAVSGDTVVTGERSDASVLPGLGAAFVFVRTGTSWREEARLTPGDGAPNHEFGRSVSLSGDVLLVGSPGADGRGERSGGGYVFIRSGTVWSQHASLSAAASGSGQNFGYQVALSGGMAAMSGPPGVAEGVAVLVRLERAALAAAAEIPVEWTQGVPLDVPLSAQGGDGPYQWRVVSGALPDGAVVDSRGARIAGTPVRSGDSAFTLEAADACGGTATFDATLHVNEPPSMAGPLPHAVAGRAYASSLAADGGTVPLSFSLDDDGGSGLSIDPSNATISGTVTREGLYELVVRATDARGATTGPITIPLLAGPRVDLSKPGARKELVPQLPQTTIRTIDLLEGTPLTVTAVAPKGAAAPTLSLIDPSGDAVDLGGTLTTRASRSKIKAFAARSTGRHALLVEPDPAAPFGVIKLTISVSPRRRITRDLRLDAAGAPVEFVVQLFVGDSLRFSVVAVAGESVEPVVQSVADAGGDPVVVAVKDGAGRVSFARRSATADELTIALSADAATSGRAIATATIRSKKGYPFAVPDPP